MIACVCKGVGEREVKTAIRKGADSLAQIGRSCGAGTACGSCHERLRSMLAKQRDADESSLPSWAAGGEPVPA